jgi:peptide/nickel transport system substrate-binding protein
VRVRKAVRIAVDRQELVDLVMAGAATVSCDTPVAPSDQYRMKKKCPPQPATAKKLLAEAGYPDGIDMFHSIRKKYLMVTQSLMFQLFLQETGEVW